ncbi:NAD(P)-dependent oxidoreductase [Streptomyces alfalfae]|uniref:NAD(P)-dependent oxidoreductase n=2 Tax=Streptomyces alfalfae TaxID=1642299 RepID=A0A4Q7EZT6_9ACTN|nr:NAD(P)-binding domain-containing protein [Streptomyces alfalfae]AYA18002.1 NAD(P)-dependent oxidoreductase [Streptomyces fradiae]QQC90093.1 NAD(P)-dependent oxidoreductase [Streptomyces alfalfae]QUI32506.1 NAD(P)-dependent oxidoreductase [Streptomyces alfalfae]RXX40119.1 NAD(P)-dependent oxidoreductase [Streptomyces alfalfae]RZM96633.1 NAD(P)-dependent oxidoreductase [Streptomyces alfalfae]
MNADSNSRPVNADNNSPAATPARTPVTVIGLGLMGSALASALLDRGHPVTVWNRSPEKAKPLADRGARVAGTPADAVAASGLVLACVLDYDALHTVLDPLAEAGALTGKALVNLTSGAPEQAEAMAAWAEEHGAGYLDGGIMTTPPGVGNPEMMFLYSGSEDVFTAHRPVLAALGDPLHLGSAPGLASLYDSALLGLMWAAFTGWLHGTALVTADGTSATDFTRVALRWLNGAVSLFLTTYAPQVDAGRYPGDDATVDVQIAAIGHLIHAAEARGVDNALPELIRSTMRRAADAGHGSDSYAGVIEVLRGPSAR